MATFGYSESLGWTPAEYPKVLAYVQTVFAGEAGPGVDAEAGPTGDMLRTLAVSLTRAWADSEAAYNAGFVSAAPGTNGVAGGSALELLLTPKIGPKLAAVASTITLTLEADSGGGNVTIPAGHAVVIDGEATPWTLDAEAEIPDGGTVDAEFTYGATGPKAVSIGATWTILNPVTGWIGVTNAVSATVGRNAETDAEYRARYRASVLNSITAAVRKVTGVTSAALVEWPHSYPDSFWGLSHWVEILVVGGDDTAVATAIQATRAKGVATVGNTIVSLTDPDYVSGSVDVRFSRAVAVPLYVDVTITQGEGYPADGSTAATAARVAAIKAAVSAYVGSLVPGQDTSAFKIASYINANAGIPGIDDIAVKVDKVDPPLNTGTLVADFRDVFTVLASNIDVSGA